MAYYECKKCGHREKDLGRKPGICFNCGSVDSFTRVRGAIGYSSDHPTHTVTAMNEFTEECCIPLLVLFVLVAIVYVIGHFLLGWF